MRWTILTEISLNRPIILAKLQRISFSDDLSKNLSKYLSKIYWNVEKQTELVWVHVIY